MSVAEVSAGSSGLSRLWTEKRNRSVLFQLIALGLLIALIVFMATNAAQNLRALGVEVGFAFLSQPSNYDINQHLIPYTSTSTHFRAGLVGLINTLLVAGLGIVAATILGFTLGILRLSSNFLVSRLVGVYIEATRNVPVLLQILLWQGIIIELPKVREAVNFWQVFFLSNRGLTMPAPIFQPSFIAAPIALVAGIVAAVVYTRWAKRRQDATGQISPVFTVNTLLIVGLPILAFLVTGRPVAWEIPEAGRFNLVGGLVLRPEFISVWVALSIYTSSFIAEIVRAGIQSVSKGQTEAAYSMGLRPNRTMRLIIIPQAFRVIVPPLTSQYLNLTKNSSLGIAVGYMDITATLGSMSLGQTGQSMEVMLILMAVYLSLSLFTSAFMNWFNERTKLVER